MLNYRGVQIEPETLRHAQHYIQSHLGPVIVTDGNQLFVRKGSRSVRLSDSVVFDRKETAQIVQNWRPE